jgi:protein O-mannosyl-transferase
MWKYRPASGQGCRRTCGVNPRQSAAEIGLRSFVIASFARKIKPHLLPAVLLLAVTALIYFRVLGHDFLVNWDDNEYVTNNEAVYGFSFANIRAVFSSFYVGNYAPVQMLSYMLDYELWGLWAGGFLLTNISLHFANGLLFYHLLHKFHKDRLLAGVGAAIFLIHPLQVESVAWISQRKNLLAMLFFLAAWKWYILYREAGEGKGGRAYAVSLVAFMLSLLSKSVTVIFPVVIVLYDYCFPAEGRRLRLADKIPFIIMAAMTAALTMHTQSVECGCGRVPFGQYGGSVFATFLTMAPVCCRYLAMLFWPVNLSADYDPVIHQTIDASVAGAVLLLAVAGYFCLRIFRSNAQHGFWAAFFLTGFLPVSQIVPLVTLMNDRYVYFPMLGAAALAGIGVAQLRDRTGPYGKQICFTVTLVPLLVLAVLSWQRCAVWQNATTLWRDAVRKSPCKSAAWERLGEASAAESPDKQEALQAFRTALQLNPASDKARFNLGVLGTALGEYDEALDHLKFLHEKNPRNVVVVTALGQVHFRRGDYGAALNAYQQAYALQPEAVEVLKSLGELALAQRQFDRARDYFGRIEKKGENDPVIAYDLARVEAAAGRNSEALSWLEKALERGYGDFRNLLYGKELAPLRHEERFAYLKQRFIPPEEENTGRTHK